MKAGSRPQYYRIRRMVQMVREGSETGCLPNSRDFMGEFGVSRRTVARDLDFLRDEESTPLEYDEARHGFRLTDETFSLPPVRISHREAFSFALARKLLAHYEATPLRMDMRARLGQDRRVAGGRHQHRAGLAERACRRAARRPRADRPGSVGASGGTHRTQGSDAGGLSELQKTPESRFPKKERTRSALTVLL